MFQNFKFEKASGIGFPKIARYCEVSVCLSLASIHTSLFIVAFRSLFWNKSTHLSCLWWWGNHANGITDPLIYSFLYLKGNICYGPREVYINANYLTIPRTCWLVLELDLQLVHRCIMVPLHKLPVLSRWQGNCSSRWRVEFRDPQDL